MKKVIQFVLPLLALAAGIFVFVMLVKTKPKAKKKPVDHRGTLVETITVKSTSHNIDVRAHGTVAAEHLQIVSPEVGGRITWLNEDIEIGAHFTAKEKIARVDAREAYLAIQQQRAVVDSAKTALEIEQGRRNIALKEWKIMGGKKPTKGSLALRDPQMRTARMQIKSARSGLLRSQLTASKALIRAPFNGIVVSKSVSKRQLVMPGAPLIVLAGTDRFLVMVSVPLRRLEWINVPGINGVKGDGGSQVEVRQTVGEKYVVRVGKVIRMNAQLDPKGRMAQLIIAIDDPLRLDPKNKATAKTDLKPEQISKLPLLIGAFVSVRITGESVDKAIELPRLALRNGDMVYVLTKDHTLDIRKVTIFWRLPRSVLVRTGLKDGDKVIVSPVPVPIRGMKLRAADKSAKATPAPKTKKKPDASTLPGPATKTTKASGPAGAKSKVSVSKP